MSAVEIFTGQAAYVLSTVFVLVVLVLWILMFLHETRRSLDRLYKVVDKIYMLSNSHMGEQLRLNVVLTSRIAGMTESQEDIAEATASEKRYKDHIVREDTATQDAGESGAATIGGSKQSALGVFL